MGVGVKRSRQLVPSRCGRAVTLAEGDHRGARMGPGRGRPKDMGPLGAGGCRVGPQGELLQLIGSLQAEGLEGASRALGRYRQNSCGTSITGRPGGHRGSLQRAPEEGLREELVTNKMVEPRRERCEPPGPSGMKKRKPLPKYAHRTGCRDRIT